LGDDLQQPWQGLLVGLAAGATASLTPLAVARLLYSRYQRKVCAEAEEKGALLEGNDNKWRLGRG